MRIIPQPMLLVGTRGSVVALAACLAAPGLFSKPLAGEIWVATSTEIEVTTLSTQSHPKRIRLAHMVTEGQRLDGAGLEYVLDRWNWNPCCDIDLAPGGKMIATLKVVRESGTRPVGGKQRTKCTSVVVEDDFDLSNQRHCFLGWDDVGIDLEPGDVVLWTVTFKKMPPLELEEYEGTLYRDRFWLTASVIPPMP